MDGRPAASPGPGAGVRTQRRGTDRYLAAGRPPVRRGASAARREAGDRPGPGCLSTRPQAHAQLGTDSHSCSYPGGAPVTSAPSGVFPQVRAVRVRSVSPHSVDNPGGGAPCRPVDGAGGCAQKVHRPPGVRSSCRGRAVGTTEAPVPGWGRGPRPAFLQGRSERARSGGAVEEPCPSHRSQARGEPPDRAVQRQRIDMIRPATIAPKPIAKFQADSETMNGIWSPAT